jgi:hypothetical protein
MLVVAMATLAAWAWAAIAKTTLVVAAPGTMAERGTKDEMELQM